MESIDFKVLTRLKDNIDRIKQERSATKQQVDEIENVIITTLLGMGVRYVDESQRGSGPFYILGKHRVEGSFNKERLLEFFELLLQKIYSSQVRLTPHECSTMAAQYLRKYEKRSIVLNKLSSCGTKEGVADLTRWVNREDE